MHIIAGVFSLTALLTGLLALEVSGQHHGVSSLCLFHQAAQ